MKTNLNNLIIELANQYNNMSQKLEQANIILNDYLENDYFDEYYNDEDLSVKLALLIYLKDYQDVEDLKEQEITRFENWFNHENFKGLDYDTIEDFVNHWQEILQGYNSIR